MVSSCKFSLVGVLEWLIFIVLFFMGKTEQDMFEKWKYIVGLQ